MKVVHNKVIDCADRQVCADAILDALSEGDSLKLMADAPDAIVNGSITINHNHPPKPHQIVIEVYEVDSASTPDRLTTLARPADFPTEAELIAKLA